MKETIALKPVGYSDIKKLARWLNNPATSKWHRNPGKWLKEMGRSPRGFSFIKIFMVLEKGQLLGFCQYYYCYDAKEEWHSTAMPDKVFSIDYFVREGGDLADSLEKEIVKAMIAEIQKRWDNCEIIAQPDDGNSTAKNIFTSNGFIFDGNRQCYVLSRN